MNDKVLGRKECNLNRLCVWRGMELGGKCVWCVGGGGVEGERREISKWKSMKTLVSNGVEDF